MGTSDRHSVMFCGIWLSCSTIPCMEQPHATTKSGGLTFSLRELAPDSWKSAETHRGCHSGFGSSCAVMAVADAQQVWVVAPLAALLCTRLHMHAGLQWFVSVMDVWPSRLFCHATSTVKSISGLKYVTLLFFCVVALFLRSSWFIQ
jgi:hypothetical protein